MVKSAQRREADGFTIVEVIIGVFVFSILAAGIASSTLLTSRMAMSNIFRNTAFTVAQGYAEQIKGIRFNAIKQALEDPGETDIPTMSLSLGASEAGDDLEKEDPLVFGQKMLKEVVVDLEESESGEIDDERIMRLWITPTGRNLRTEPEGLAAIEITLDYEWEFRDNRGTRTFEDSIKIVKTHVSEY